MKTKSVFSAFRQTVLIVLALMMSSISFAQKDSTVQAKKKLMIETQKIAFLTKKLDLTATEAQNFWPVYNEYDAQKELIFKANRENNKKLKNIETLTEKEAQAIIDAQLVADEKLLKLKKDYMKKFSSVIPVVKVVKLDMAEKEFRKELLKTIKNQKKPMIEK